MNERRIEGIKSLLTDNPDTVNYLCSLPDDRYPIVFEAMKLAKLLELQKASSHDIRLVDDICNIYAVNGVQKLALMAYMYGKITGKKEERAKKHK